MLIRISVENGENIYKKEALSFESAVECVYKLQRVVEAREEEELDDDEEFVYPEDNHDKELAYGF